MVKPVNDNRFGIGKIILPLFIISAALFLVAPVLANAEVTIATSGNPSYYWGEKVVFSGMNNASDTTYLFMTGPNLPDAGGNLTLPFQHPVGGDPGSFTVVKTKPGNTWEYTLYTSGVLLDAGMYTIYAASQPKSKDQFDNLTIYGTTSLILKRPFITAAISPSPVLKGQPFWVNGSAEGNPRTVQVWIVGDNFLYNTMVSTNPDSSFMYYGDTRLSGQLPEGQCYLIAQHPMQNTQIDILTSGDWVKMLRHADGNLTDATNLFRFRGTGSLQGNDAAEAIIAAIRDHTTGDDTYTVIPFRVVDAGFSTPVTSPAATTPVQHPTQSAPLQYAPVGALVLIMGIVVWNRRRG
ncbi:hypothetical protein [Methanoregula sp.]|uniref:hypothetical protein n=1 Tax=Methanoregula sp. TaxID=2052170 RepID=UPI00356531C5